MTTDLATAAAGDLAELLAVVERWAGSALVEPSAFRGEVHEGRVAVTDATADDDVPTLAVRHAGTSPSSAAPRHAAPSVRERGPNSATTATSALPTTIGTTEDRRARQPMTVAPPSSSGRVLPPWPFDAGARWSGRLPSPRTDTRAERAAAASWDTSATRSATAIPPAPGTSRAQEADVTGTPALDGSTRLERAPATAAFPVPHLVGHLSSTATSAAGGHDAGREWDGERSPTARSVDPPPWRELEPTLAEVLGLNRLGEIIADVIEAALIDAGVDVS